MLNSGILNIIGEIAFNIYTIIRDESRYFLERPMGCQIWYAWTLLFSYGDGSYLGNTPKRPLGCFQVLCIPELLLVNCL